MHRLACLDVSDLKEDSTDIIEGSEKVLVVDILPKTVECQNRKEVVAMDAPYRVTADPYMCVELFQSLKLSQGTLLVDGCDPFVES